MEINNSLTSSDILMILGKRVRDYRMRLNMTQQEIADKAGVSVLTIHRFENGISKNVPFSVFILVMKALGLVSNLDRALPDLPPSPYEYDENSRKRQRIRHKKN